MQTKQQSIGYILRAFLDNGSNTSELLRIFLELDKTIHDEGQTIGNNNTVNYLHYVMEYFRMGQERVTKVNSSLYNAFDIYTEEEAQDFYEAFLMIFKLNW